MSKKDLEGRFLGSWLKKFPKLPKPDRQVQFHPSRKWRWDFSWEVGDTKLAVEIQGGSFMGRYGRHNNAYGQAKDYEKWREGVRLGWKILPFNTVDMRDPDNVTEFVAEFLTGAGEVYRVDMPEYRCWHAIIQRCCNPDNGYFSRYGGRGITICKEWKESFESFLSGVGRRPSKKHSIDRIDNSKGYEPGNVRWATRKEQQNNLRSNRLITFRGETKNMTQWAESLGVGKTRISQRLRAGWSIERALSTPTDQRFARHRK